MINTIRSKIDVIYGGAKVGLMGAVADGALEDGGKVIGVLPEFLMKREIAHDGISELIIVNSMQERKKKMLELSDGFISLPGGFGTLDEFYEILTWEQLGIHQKPSGLLNINNFYSPLLKMMDGMVEEGFLKQINRDMVMTSDNLSELINKMSDYRPVKIGKWIGKDKI